MEVSSWEIHPYMGHLYHVYILNNQRVDGNIIIPIGYHPIFSHHLIVKTITSSSYPPSQKDVLSLIRTSPTYRSVAATARHVRTRGPWSQHSAACSPGSWRPVAKGRETGKRCSGEALSTLGVQKWNGGWYIMIYIYICKYMYVHISYQVHILYDIAYTCLYLWCK